MLVSVQTFGFSIGLEFRPSLSPSKFLLLEEVKDQRTRVSWLPFCCCGKHDQGIIYRKGFILAYSPRREYHVGEAYQHAARRVTGSIK